MKLYPDLTATSTHAKSSRFLYVLTHKKMIVRAFVYPFLNYLAKVGSDSYMKLQKRLLIDFLFLLIRKWLVVR